MAMVVYQEKKQEVEKVPTLGEYLPRLEEILNLSFRPALQGYSQEQIREQQAKLLQTRAMHLANAIEKYSLELGCLLIEGGKLGLHRLMGYDSVWSWLRDGIHISTDVLSLASKRYQAWLYIRPYGFSPEVVRALDPIKVQRIEDMNRDIARQKKAIADRIHEDAPDIQAQEEIARADQEFKSRYHAEIEYILSVRSEDLQQERAAIGGEPIRPDLILRNASYDPDTGRFTAIIEAYLEEGHIQALLKSQHRLLIQQPDGQKLTQQEYARKLIEQREDYFFDDEEENN